MYGNPYLNSAFNIERLNRQKEEIDNLIKSYQNVGNQQPINNFINTNTPVYDDTVLVKKLNDSDEVENILISKDTIFIGNNRMQIKKLDGTIEKYNIEKYYPIDEKDEKIKELNKKVEELERKLNNEQHSSDAITTTKFNKSNSDDNEHIKSKSKTNGKSVSE